MPYKLVDGKFVKDENDRFINGASRKRAIWQALIEQMKRAEASEARAAQLQAERDCAWAEDRAIRQAINADENESTLDEVLRLKYQRIAQEERIKQLQSEINYLRSTDHAANLAMERDAAEAHWHDDDERLSAFEHTAPLDWRESETPLGQKLDGIGDEVEA